MKKFLSLIIAAFLLVSVFALSSCKKDSRQVLTYGKKYYLSYLLDDEKDSAFYIFNKKGTGEYSYYDYFDYNDKLEIKNYTVKFKYLIIEDTVICFYDSKSYGEDHNTSTESPSSTWTVTLGFSKNILMNTSGNIYICENYLKKIPNFANNLI